VVSATDRDLWQGPKQEVRKSRTSGFCAQPQKIETITVTIGYKNKQLLRLRVTLAPARGLDPWRWPERSQLWGRERDRVSLIFFSPPATRREKSLCIEVKLRRNYD